MAQEAAKTGSGPTAMIAVEQYFPHGQRILDDDLAYRILPLGERTFVWLMRFAPLRDWMVRATERTIPGIWGGMVCRKRYIDEKVTESAGKFDAVVNLGAGFDTRAYRLPALASVPVWEVDLPGNIERKRDRLQKVLGTIPDHVTVVPIDFDREALSTSLSSHGYSAEMRTFFIWEAVTQYLTEGGIRATFDFLAKAAAGSRLAFTYVRKDFIDGQVLYGQEAMYKQYILKDKMWVFGMDPDNVTGFVEAYGWRVVEHLGYEVLAERYVRPTGRELGATAVERMVYAEKV